MRNILFCGYRDWSKEIYKRLIKKLHPDKQEEDNKKECEEKLKHITKLYNEKRWINLIAYAYEEKIKLPYIPVEYNKELEKQITDIEKTISLIKTKISWVWSTQIKPHKQARELLYPSMNIEVEKFKKWKNENS